MNKLNEIFDKTKTVFRNYPLILLSAFIGACTLIWIAEHNFRNYGFEYTKIVIISCLGISLMFGLKIISQRIRKPFIFEIIGILFLIFFYFILSENNEIWGYVITTVFILSHLLVSFGAFFGKNREKNFWQYNKNLFVNFFLTIIFSGVLTIGVELAILAVDKLFGVNFDSIYLNTFYFLFVFGSCFIFLLFNENGLEYLEKDGTYPVILKFFTQYILVPLLFIYVVILYFYMGKILLNWELPRGWVSYLVLAYSVVGILALLLVHPLKEESAKSWVKVFSKIFYYTLIPLIALLFTAIFTRVLEYGYTEPRYFVLLIAIWLTSVVLYFIFVKKPTIKFVPISLFTFGVFALIFPFLNAFSVTKISQKNRLKHLLSENQLLENGTINFDKKIADSVAYAIGDKFEFLEERKEHKFLETLLKPKDRKILKTENDTLYYELRYNIINQFASLKQTSKVNTEYWQHFSLVSEKKVFDTKEYDYFFKIPSYYNNDQFNKFNIGTDHFTTDLEASVEKDDKFIITLNDTEKWDVSSSLNKIMDKYKGKSGEMNVSEISVETDLGKYHLKIVCDKLQRDYGVKTVTFNNENAMYLFIKAK